MVSADLAVPSIPLSVAVPVIIVASLIPPAGFLAAGFGARSIGDPHPWRLGSATALALAAWGGVGIGMARIHLLWGEPQSLTALWLAVAYLAPGIVVMYALRRMPRLRAALESRSGLWRLVSCQ